VTITLTERRGMHRHSDETVAAVVRAAVIALRNRQGWPVQYPLTPWDELPAVIRTTRTETVRSIRSGVLPREQYETARGPDDPPYDELPVSRRDEDQLAWFVTQALTGD
jgi:hypothetical protein